MTSLKLLKGNLENGLCDPDKTRAVVNDGINMLFFGDNLHILRECIPDNFVDLIYIDPPFNSKRTYNILFEEGDLDHKVQEQAYSDSWKWDQEIEKRYSDLAIKGFPELKGQLDNLRDFILRSEAIPDSYMAYIVMMSIRLIELKRVLKLTGSIYLHCDSTMSHYLKILLDAIFSVKNFRNEIVWCYRGAGTPKKDFARRHDIILRYSKSEDYLFNVDDVRDEYAEATKNRFKHYIGNVRQGRDYGKQSLNPKGKHPNDWWEIQPVAPSAKERMYPTQKPEQLLKKIILASSNENDIVLDAFCGSSTTMLACSKLKRRWIGIDLSMLAASITTKRINELDTEDKYYLLGLPQSIKQLEQMIEEHESNRFKLEYWISNLLSAKLNKKQRRNGGVESTLYFKASANAPLTRKVLIQITTGKVGVKDLRDLIRIVEKDKMADIGYLVCLKKSQITDSMKKTAQAMGNYQPAKEMLNRFFNPKSTVPKIPKIAIVSIEEIIQEEEPYRLIKYPHFIEGNQSFYW